MDNNEVKVALYARLMDSCVSVVKIAGGVYGLYWIYRIFDTLAGKITFADILVSILLPEENTGKFKNILIVVLGLFGAIATKIGYSKNKSKKKYIVELETRINKKRQSSQIPVKKIKK